MRLNYSEPDYDVVVVGGGPGGSTAATFVAMQGHRVLLLEKEKTPVYKIGESLLPATVHGICAMLGVTKALKEANFVVKRGGTFRWGRQKEPWSFLFAASSSMPGPASTAYQVERMKFDSILLQNARARGVEVREQHAATGLITEARRVTGLRYTDQEGVEKLVHARYVVDATGHQTKLARHVGERVESKFFQNVALFGYYRNARRLKPPNEGNIFCAAFNKGWFWFIPLSSTLTSVGVVIGKEHAAELSSGPEKAMLALIQECSEIRDLLAGAHRVTQGPYGQLRVRKDYSYLHSRFWAPGIVLVGDSACFIDPVFSSGVHLATYSGLLAARSINTCLQGMLDEAECFSEFEVRYRREFSLFYDFLLAFYDTHADTDSYFWHARKVTNSAEEGNEAFLRLVAGLGGSGEQVYAGPEEFLSRREGLGSAIFPATSEAGQIPEPNGLHRKEQFYQDLLHETVQVQAQAVLGSYRPAESPVMDGGLVPSSDGLHWVRGVKAAAH